MLGSINMDLVVRAPRLPGAGETVLGGGFSLSPGGKGANQAVAAARMGADVAFIGAVGEDEYGARMLAVLGAEGIDVSRVAKRPGVATGVAVITVAEGGENTIVVAPGANAAVSPADVEAAKGAIAAADVLLMQLETPVAAVMRAAELARDCGTTVVLNAAPAAPLSAELLAGVDVLVVNRGEAGVVAGARTPGTVRSVTRGGFVKDGEAAEPGTPGDLEPGAAPVQDELVSKIAPVLARLAGLGVAKVVLTLGGRGAVYLRGPAAAVIEPYRVEAVDTVGAGDAFTGVLACRLAEHQAAGATGDMYEIDAMHWAAAAGALAVTRAGAIPSLPRRAEVVELLRRMG